MGEQMNTDKLKELAMNDNGFIFDPNSGYSYTTNETGMFILKHMANGKDTDDICRALCEEYECTEDHFHSDFDHFLLMLEALNLVEL